METYTIDDIKNKDIAVYVNTRNEIEILAEKLGIYSYPLKDILYRFEKLKNTSDTPCLFYNMGRMILTTYSCLKNYNYLFIYPQYIDLNKHKTPKKAQNKPAESADTPDIQTPAVPSIIITAGQRWRIFEASVKDLINLAKSLKTAEELEALQKELADFVAAHSAEDKK